MTNPPTRADRAPVDRAARRYDVVVRWANVASTSTDAPWLGPAARERLVVFRDDADRRRFVGARLLLRRVVADLAGLRPTDVVLAQHCTRCGGAHGRPHVVVAGRAGPEVSMAHAGDLAIVAVGRQALGVDVEPISDDVDPSGVGSLRDWVRREAALKATGQGIDQDPSPVQLGSPSEPPRLTGWTGPGRRPALRIADLVTEAGHLAAVARRGRRPLRIDAQLVDLSAG